MPDLTEFKKFKPLQAPLELEDFKVLYGANYFSGGPVVRFRVNLGVYDEVFTNEIQGFYNKLKTLVPSLYEHHCSVGKPGGFLLRIKRGTLLGHVMEHLAIELQTMAGMDVGFGKTRMTQKQGVYNVVFRYFDEIAGIYAGKASLHILNSILTNQVCNVNEFVDHLIIIREKRLLGFSTQAIVDEADMRGIPSFRLNKYNLVQLGMGKYRKIIRATITGNTSLIGVETTDDKFRTTQILGEAGVPVPKRIITEEYVNAKQFFNELNKPVVVKPATGYQGKGISVDIKDESLLQRAFLHAAEFDAEVVVQEYIPGKSYRLLVVNNQCVAAVELVPPEIIGNGTSSVQELINMLNSEPGREYGDKGKSSIIEVDEEVLYQLEINGLDLNSVLPENKKVVLRNSGNLRLGGISVDVTDEVAAINRYMAERISRILNLDVAGIDILSDDISIPVTENNAVVVEVNAAPDLKMHISPVKGEPRLVQKNFVDMLFPEGEECKIPVMSVTGSFGKRDTALLLDGFLNEMGYDVGRVSRDGVFISGRQIVNQPSAKADVMRMIMHDPTVDCAVFETTVESILSAGLGYNFADIGIVLNLDKNKKDYFEYDHVFDLDDIAYAKSVVAEEVYEDGYSILNADDPLISEMSERLYSNPAWFSLNAKNEILKAHMESNGYAAYIDSGRIFVFKGTERLSDLNIQEIPYLKTGNIVQRKQVVLASLLALIIRGAEIEKLKKYICLFNPGN
ncbi:MAG: hypothetical protein C0594_09160 [Marinilabiliales bacterium]|nr:MAG: hypothetical protein C0594_09160 [Marinilabiliales bacterium]